MNSLKGSPYKVLAMTAEGRLLKEPRHEAVVLDDVDILFLKGSLSSAELLGECGIRIAGSEGILARVVCFLIVRHRALNWSILRANGPKENLRRESVRGSDSSAPLFPAARARAAFPPLSRQSEDARAHTPIDPARSPRDSSLWSLQSKTSSRE